MLTSFSILAKDQILWVKSCSAANVCALLTIIGHVEWDTALEQKANQIKFKYENVFYSSHLLIKRNAEIQSDYRNSYLPLRLIKNPVHCVE